MSQFVRMGRSISAILEDHIRWRILAAILLALVSTAPVLHADIVFSNLASSCGVCGIAIEGSGPPFSLAAAFTPTGDYLLTGAKARFAAFTDSTVNFFIYSNATDIPGLLLGGLGSVTLPESTIGLFTAGGPISPLLLADGVEYWLVLTPGTTGTRVAWQDHGSNSLPFAATVDATGASHWAAASTQALQFEIDGAPAGSSVPEPGFFGLSTAFLAVTLLISARRTASGLRSTKVINSTIELSQSAAHSRLYS